jgi:hypothetical protein
MLQAFEQEELALLGVPVSPNALETCRPIHERVRHDPDPSVAEGHESALVIALDEAFAGQHAAGV